MKYYIENRADAIIKLETEMKRILVWDVPIRLFHWILVVCFAGAFVIANTMDDESPTFPVHMLLGAVMAMVVLLRFVWGIGGTRWARFSSFAAAPGEAFAYLKGAFTGKGEKRFTGHNPGSSIAAIVMFICIIGLAVTGVMMGSGVRGGVKEVHELFQWVLLATVAAHLAGIAFYSIRHREVIALSMVSGRKTADEGGAISSARPVWGLVMVAILALWTIGLVRGYDSSTGQAKIPLTGQVLHVGEGAEYDEGGGDADLNGDHEEHEEKD